MRLGGLLDIPIDVSGISLFYFAFIRRDLE